MINHINKFWYLFDELIELNSKRIDDTVDMLYYLDKVSYSKEYATVRIDVGRQLGKTSFIMLNSKHNDCVIVLNKLHQKDFKQRQFLLRQPTITTPSSKFDKITCEINRVWIDNASFVSDKQIDSIYEHFCKVCNTRQFILIG